MNVNDAANMNVDDGHTALADQIIGVLAAVE